MAALVQISETPRWKKMWSFVGPGFLVSVAYLDPGNLETDLQAGANHKYELLWIVLFGLSFALITQSRSANLGVATGMHLSEHCKAEYPKLVNYCLWILAEVSVIAADIPEVIGTAFALHILFGAPLWAGVLLAGLNTLLLLALQRYGIRKLEVAIAALMLIMGGCFFAEMAHIKPNAAKILRGMFVPKLSSNQATSDAIALLGALIMPHNLFLHSGLVMSRKIPHSFHGINSACRYFLYESAAALFIAFLINISIVSVSASVCFRHDLSSSNEARCRNLTLNSAAFLLKNALGEWSLTLYAISLLASGQSSAVTGTYAGQYIMQGFLDLKMQPWLRNLVTRCIAITPSLVASIIGGPSGASRLIIIASMILSFQLPFALIPLLKFTSSETKMGQHRNSLPVTAASWVLGLCMIGINMYYVSTSSLGWLTHHHSPRVGSILAATIVLPSMMLYMGMLVYLALKRETAVTCSQPLPMSGVRSHQTQIEREHNTDSPTGQEQEIEIVCRESQPPASRAHDVPPN